MNDFSAALNNFQAVQRRAAEKERESVARARAGSRLSVSRSRDGLTPLDSTKSIFIFSLDHR